jgi:hypothetical protein
VQLELTSRVVVARWFSTLACLATTMGSHSDVDRNRDDFVLVHVSVLYNFICLHFEKENNLERSRRIMEVVVVLIGILSG